jgi:chromosome segregation ATPase
LEDVVVKECLSNIAECQAQMHQLEDEVTINEREIEDIRSSMSNKIFEFFQLKGKGNGDVSTLVQQLMNEEQEDLNRLSKNRDDLKTEKTRIVEQMTEANSRFEKLKKELLDLEKQDREFLEDMKRQLSPSRCTTSLMQTKFQLDNNSRCVSLILDNQRRVERIARVDKENTPETELRQTIWSKFDSLYPQHFL